jgi:type I restriction enzyme M protein
LYKGDVKDSELYDVIGMNPPYGGSSNALTVKMFPADLRSSETADLFVILIMSRLARGGRAGVIIPDGFLFGDGNKQKIKEKMLKEFNVHTIIRLPGSVFSPYTGIATNIIFFNREKAAGAPEGFCTKETWFYRLDMPEGIKHFSKTKPMKFEHCQPILDWWDNRREIEEYNADGEISGYKSKSFTPDELVAINCNFDQCKFPKDEEEILSPSELLSDYYTKRRALDNKIDNTLLEIESTLGIKIKQY